jgi:predicted DNA-binding transcriptional regulator YafY
MSCLRIRSARDGGRLDPKGGMAAAYPGRAANSPNQYGLTAPTYARGDRSAESDTPAERRLRIERLERLINLVIALRETRHPLPAAQIRTRVAGYGQSDDEAFRRMFERDKADLRALGVPVETAAVDVWGEEWGYRIPPDAYDLPELDLSAEELAALALALEATGLGDESGHGLLKLQVDADQPAADDPAPPAAVALDLAEPRRARLMEAQLSRTTVRFTYRRADRATSRRTVDPYALVHRAGRWYLVGRDHQRNAARSFRLDRIEGEVSLVGDSGAFDPPRHAVSADDVVPTAEEGPEVAEVAASAEVAWQVARVARGGGTPDERSDWTVFTVPVGDPDRFVDWVLGFGPEVEVRAPAQLRRDVVATLGETLRLATDAARGVAGGAG